MAFILKDERKRFFVFVEKIRPNITLQKSLVDKYTNKYGEDKFQTKVALFSAENGYLNGTFSSEEVLRYVFEVSETEKDPEKLEFLSCVTWFQIRRWAAELGLSNHMNKIIEEELA